MNKFRQASTEKEQPKKPGKAAQFFYSLLDGSILNKESSLRNLPFALFIFFIGLIYISISHSFEKKTREISRLSKASKDVYSEYITLESELTKKSIRTNLADELSVIQIKESKVPPKKLIKPQN